MNRTKLSCVPTLLATALLAACGGGSSDYGMVRSNPPPPAPPPPVSTEPCSGTMTTDCTVAPTQAEPVLEMTDGRTSAHALIKQGDGTLSLGTGTFAFAGGTDVQAGGLVINYDAVLASNLAIAADSGVSVIGAIEGHVDVAENGNLYLYGTITGNVANAGFLSADTVDGVAYPQRIEGDFVQTETGTLTVLISADRPVMLEVTGLAQLAGLVQMMQGIDWDYMGYPLPETPSAVPILHADGGVSGEFADWGSPGLFVEGALRYEPNDVFFDVTAVSAESVMAAAPVGDALTLEAARRFDGMLAATGAAKGTFDPRALSQAQDRLLRSAAIVQRIDDYAQAVRTFDSLSGHGHVAAVDAYMQNALQAAPTIAAHLDATPRGANGSWAAQPATFAVAGGTFQQKPTFGYDLQLANGTRVGSSVAWSEGTLDLARGGGVAQSRAPQFNVYVHHAGQRGYATGMMGFSRQAMDLERTIDLGGISQLAHTRRDVDTTFGYFESGRAMAFGGGRITPFAAAHWSQARAGAFAEQGVTGFELVGDASLHERLGGDIGARWTRDWGWNSGHWLRLDAGMRHRHLFQASDVAQVAYVGAPGWMFDLHGAPVDRDAQMYSFGLVGGRDARWAWSLRFDSYAEDNAMSFAFGRGF
ncbi:autotransporter domain-containing protein [Lysobacter sp. A6]|uniref:Autotransporter domain-containing protein n=1 Tax=Noviluteimonas lactosilytica TaxID=2888523 RepID=A0ABS8JH71_9GAMM|nr:autotransporter domain-containing protein [Lysobacter lactosilyticus]MCC8362912.1 autotransporter domain-containing protein [Lysobacter lactosilyticus]